MFPAFIFLDTIVGAVAADQYLGRLQAILCASNFYAAGLMVLVASSAPAASENGLAVTGLLLAMLLLAIWCWRHKAQCQCVDGRAVPGTKGQSEDTEEGEKVVLDPAKVQLEFDAKR